MLRPIFAALFAALIAGCSSDASTPLETVSGFDLARYLGDWNQIAAIPAWFQSACAAHTTASRLQQATRTLNCDLVVSQELVNAIKSENGPKNMEALLSRLHRHGEFEIRGRSRSVDIWTFRMASEVT